MVIEMEKMTTNNLIKINKEIINCDKCKQFSSVINLPQPGYFKGSILVVLQNPGIPATKNVELELTKRDNYKVFQQAYKKTIKSCYMGKFISLIVNDWSKISVTNIVKCPTKQNSHPADSIIKNCRRFIFEQIEELNPRVILCVGSVSNKIIPKHNNYVKLHIPHYSYLYRFNLDVDKYVNDIKEKIDEYL